MTANTGPNDLRTAPRGAWKTRRAPRRYRAGASNDLAQLCEPPQVAARGMRITRVHTAAGDIPLAGNPFRFDGQRPDAPGAPPLLDEHTDEVLGALPGKQPAELAALRAAAVI